MTPTSHEVSQLLVAWGSGDEVARDRLMPLVYDELHRLAHQYMRRERPAHTLQTSALVNEAYLRLVDQSQVHWENRGHFFGIAARLMRRILVETARRKNSLKRGERRERVDLDEVVGRPSGDPADVLAVDEVLDQLARVDPQAAQLVKLRFFSGLTGDEAAAVLGVSPRSADFLWSYARAWIFDRLGG